MSKYGRRNTSSLVKGQLPHKIRSDLPSSRSPACHRLTPEECWVPHDQAVVPSFAHVSCHFATVGHSRGISRDCLAPGAVPACRRGGGPCAQRPHWLRFHGVTIRYVLIQRPSACLRVKKTGGFCGKWQSRTSQEQECKNRVPWVQTAVGSGQWFQRHKALAIEVIVVLFERCKGSVEDSQM